VAVHFPVAHTRVIASVERAISPAVRPIVEGAACVRTYQPTPAVCGGQTIAKLGSRGALGPWTLSQVDGERFAGSKCRLAKCQASYGSVRGTLTGSALASDAVGKCTAGRHLGATTCTWRL
jgi:hypothetical protein